MVQGRKRPEHHGQAACLETILVSFPTIHERKTLKACEEKLVALVFAVSSSLVYV